MNKHAKTTHGNGILITTQKVDQNDPLLGFFIRWIKEFSLHFDQVTVVCLEKGDYELPENVKVYSLGKLRTASLHRFFGRLHARTGYFLRLLHIAWSTRRDYDYVFVHMNPEYIVSCGLLWRFLGKTIALWYTHKQVDRKLRIAEKLTHLVFTASVESFRLSSSKVRVVGHGIDTDYFKPTAALGTEKPDVWKLISVGRISPAKGGEVLLRGLAALREKGVPATLSFIGEPAVTGDREYLEFLKKLTHELDLDEAVEFSGAIPHRDIPALLRGAAVYVNASKTGSVDKGVLEAMSCGVLVITSNEAFASLLPTELIFPAGDHHALADRLFHLYSLTENERALLTARLRSIVVERHSIGSLIEIIATTIQGKHSAK